MAITCGNSSTQHGRARLGHSAVHATTSHRVNTTALTAHAALMGVRHLQTLGTRWQRSNRRNVAVVVIAASLSGTMAAAAIKATTTAMSGSELAALMTINARQQYITLAIDR